ncbi:FG-GAP repeat domain-containing protein [Streptomyces sp. NPDC004266]|uniref:FG-GAP repeat domain-containing protein n=1 Tax=Streptomyces sp. NPDC004266 TaxID=3364693 RepID=UPI0036B741ED
MPALADRCTPRPRSSTCRLSWDTHDAEKGDVPNGDYTWTITAETLDGIPLGSQASGPFKLVRQPAAHDLNVNGAFGLLQQDSAGGLWRTDSTYYGGELETDSYRHEFIGPGWQICNRITGGSDLTGDGRPDVLAADKTGVLWGHLGKGDGTFAPRTRLGGGWNAYSHAA